MSRDQRIVRLGSIDSLAEVQPIFMYVGNGAFHAAILMQNRGDIVQVEDWEVTLYRGPEVGRNQPSIHLYGFHRHAGNDCTEDRPQGQLHGDAPYAIGILGIRSQSTQPIHGHSSILSSEAGSRRYIGSIRRQDSGLEWDQAVDRSWGGVARFTFPARWCYQGVCRWLLDCRPGSRMPPDV